MRRQDRSSQESGQRRGPGPASRRARREGFTLIELVVALGLASLLMAALVSLLDSALRLWSKGEVKRNLVEQSAGTGELIAHDFRMLHPGAQGDLLVEWVAFDVDGDSVRERYWPRVRMVRQASAGEISGLGASPSDLMTADELALEAFEKAGGQVPKGYRAKPDSAATGAGFVASTEGSEVGHPEQLSRPPVGPGLIEVVWCILPDGKDPDTRESGVMYRAERPLEALDETSYFSPGFFDGAERPPAGELEVVTGGILWCGLELATQTTLLDEGWKIGPQLSDACASWDAWSGDRPDTAIHIWNEAGAGMPRAQGIPLLPRRVRFEFEFEGPKERLRRPRLVEAFDAVATSFDVSNGAQLPEVGRYVLIGAEWMKVNGVRDDHLTVKRGQRGTAAVNHMVDEMIHHGVPVATEVPIRVHVGVWNY